MSEPLEQALNKNVAKFILGLPAFRISPERHTAIVNVCLKKVSSNSNKNSEENKSINFLDRISTTLEILTNEDKLWIKVAAGMLVSIVFAILVFKISGVRANDNPLLILFFLVMLVTWMGAYCIIYSTFKTKYSIVNSAVIFFSNLDNDIKSHVENYLYFKNGIDSSSLKEPEMLKVFSLDISKYILNQRIARLESSLKSQNLLEILGAFFCSVVFHALIGGKILVDIAKYFLSYFGLTEISSSLTSVSLFALTTTLFVFIIRDSSNKVIGRHVEKLKISLSYLENIK
jgi:hypothetical protein